MRSNHSREPLKTSSVQFKATLELKNVTSVSHHVRVIPPSTSFFSIGLGTFSRILLQPRTIGSSPNFFTYVSSGRFPGDGGMVAPGMSCKYTIRFAPDSLGDYEDFVTVEMPMENLMAVPIMAKRPPPVLKRESVTPILTQLPLEPVLIGGQLDATQTTDLTVDIHRDVASCC